ncbi:hypothetical protein RN001_013158 [Aquatica leii]|uniref:Uncharacterized protein n=1 Tax=Aquatica leii TaxID=1421715 RepID=A0AAN7QCW8_9COLE|nr:hypothetical protein RN001_013158 [Aquatica leii]
MKLFSDENLFKCSALLAIRKNNNLGTVLSTQQNNFQLYHSKCYRRFTALPPKYRKSTSASSSSTLPYEKNYFLGNRKIYFLRISLKTEILVCVSFAGKRFKGREEKLLIFTKNGWDSIETLAIESNDSDMVEKLQNLQSDQYHFFHKNCKNHYITSRESILRKGKEKSEWNFTRDIRAEAYDVVEEAVFFLKLLNDMFIEHLKKNQQDVSNYSVKPHHLKRDYYKNLQKIIIISFKGQSLVKPFKGIIIY